MRTAKFNLTQNKAKKLYELLIDELRKRIKNIQQVDNSLHGEPDEIIQFYLDTALNEMKEKRSYCANAKDKSLADLYFISRVIGSCSNAQGRRNVFKTYYGDFLSARDLEDKKIVVPWKSKNPNELPQKYSYWDCMLLLKISGDLDKDNNFDRSGLSKILYNFDVEQIANSSSENLLNQFREQAKKNVENYNREHWKNADKEIFVPKGYNYQNFEEKNRLFPVLAECLVYACNKVQEQGGCAKWLRKISKKLDDNEVTFDQFKQNLEEIKTSLNMKKWKGYGPALCQDFFKDMGFSNFGKADTHVVGLLKGLVEGGSINIELGNNCEDNVNDFLNYFAAQLKDGKTSANQIDKIIWLLMSGRFYKHTTKAYPLDTIKGKHTERSKLCRRLADRLKNS